MNPPSDNANQNGALFDIKVGIIGPVGSGKTTVVNALLGNAYGHVDIAGGKPATSSGDGIPDLGRTTTDVTQYRLVRKSSVELRPTQHDTDVPRTLPSNASFDSASYYPPSHVTSHYWTVQEEERQQQEQHYRQQTLLEANTRNYQPGDVRVRQVDVAVDHEMMAMRDDTQLVLVDIPGIDCTALSINTDDEKSNATTCPYAAYVQNHLDSFDCLIVVLDVTAANPADQEKLLQFVQHNLDQQLNNTPLPVVCLWNKLDDPYDPKALAIIRKTQEMVQSMMAQSRTMAREEELRQQRAQERARNDKDGDATIPFKLEILLGQNRPTDAGFGPPLDTKPSTEEPKLSKDRPDDKPSSQQNSTVVPESAEANTNNSEVTNVDTALAAKNPILFLPLSAKEALVYKQVVNMTLEDFEPWMQHDWMVERLGRDQIGLRRWNRLSRQQQVEESYEMLRDPSEYTRALESCGYAAVERMLEELVGNVEGAQTTMLEARMEYSVRTLLDPPTTSGITANRLLAPQVYSVYTKFQVLYGNTEAAQQLPQQLQAAFWASYDAMETEALRKVVEMGPTYVTALAEPLDQLSSYLKISKVLEWQERRNIIEKRTKSFVLQYLQLLLEQESLYDYEAWGDHFQSVHHKGLASEGSLQDRASPWQSLSPKDWAHIWSSILLVSYDRYFCGEFGREKILVEELLEKARSSWKTYQNLTLRICPHCGLPLKAHGNEWRCETCKFAFFTCFPSTQCNSCAFKFDFIGHPEVPHLCQGNGYSYSTQQGLQSWMAISYNRAQQLVPNHPTLYNRVVLTGNIPESLTDCRNFGHPFYQFCNLKESMSFEAKNP